MSTQFRFLSHIALVLLVLASFLGIADLSLAQSSPQPLAATAYCNGRIVELNITSGDAPFLFFLDGNTTGISIPDLGVNYTRLMVINQSLVLTEQGGDGESLSLGPLDCGSNNLILQATMTCDNGDLVVNIISGDPFFAIIGTGPGLPLAVQTTGVYRFPGPAIWTDLNVHEPVGNPIEHINFGNLDCTVPPLYPPDHLAVRYGCNGNNGWVMVDWGDMPFVLRGTAPGLAFNLPMSMVYTLQGPGTWSDLVITETVRDQERFAVPELTCPAVTTVPEPPPQLPPQPIVLPDYVLSAMVEIPVSHPQLVYTHPGGEPIHNADSSLLLLPHDADGNGSDTFIVLDAQLYEGEVWLGIYLGGPNLGWLPQADLYPTD